MENLSLVILIIFFIFVLCMYIWPYIHDNEFFAQFNKSLIRKLYHLIFVHEIRSQLFVSICTLFYTIAICH